MAAEPSPPGLAEEPLMGLEAALAARSSKSALTIGEVELDEPWPDPVTLPITLSNRPIASSFAQVRSESGTLSPFSAEPLPQMLSISRLASGFLAQLTVFR